MVVQSNWSWLPTILLLSFYVDVSERTVIYKLPDIRQIRGNVSAGTLPIAFERTEESSSFNS